MDQTDPAEGRPQHDENIYYSYSILYDYRKYFSFRVLNAKTVHKNPVLNWLRSVIFRRLRFLVLGVLGSVCPALIL